MPPSHDWFLDLVPVLLPAEDRYLSSLFSFPLWSPWRGLKLSASEPINGRIDQLFSFSEERLQETPLPSSPPYVSLFHSTSSAIRHRSRLFLRLHWRKEGRKKIENRGEDKKTDPITNAVTGASSPFHRLTQVRVPWWLIPCYIWPSPDPISNTVIPQWVLAHSSPLQLAPMKISPFPLGIGRTKSAKLKRSLNFIAARVLDIQFSNGLFALTVIQRLSL